MKYWLNYGANAWTTIQNRKCPFRNGAVSIEFQFISITIGDGVSLSQTPNLLMQAAGWLPRLWIAASLSGSGGVIIRIAGAAKELASGFDPDMLCAVVRALAEDPFLPRPTERPSLWLMAILTYLRKSIDDQATLVSHSFNLDLFSASLFFFCNKGHDLLKILYLDHNCFWLYYRCLERGRFRWPARSSQQKAVAISRRQLQWLLDWLTREKR